MSVVRELRTTVTPEQVISAIDASIGRTDTAIVDIRQSGPHTVGLAVYEQYFMRAGNRAAITVVADNLSDDGTTLVRIVATASSRGLVFNLDWGAAGDYAAEAASIVESLEASAPPQDLKP